MNVELLTRAEARERFPQDYGWLNLRQRLLVIDGAVWGKSVLTRVRGRQRYRIHPLGAWAPCPRYVETADQLPRLVKSLLRTRELQLARGSYLGTLEAIKQLAQEQQAKQEQARDRAAKIIKPFACNLTFEEQDLLVDRIAKEIAK